MTNLVQKLVFCCFAMLLLFGHASAQETNSVVGTWNMVSVSDQGEIHWTLTISKDGDHYKGVSSTDDGEQPISDLKIDGNTVVFQVPYQGDQYRIRLTMRGNTVDGKWSGNGAEGQTSGKKADTR